ncbi:MAG: hypothetical protein H0Z35_06885 [Thermoanaerobacteraceae bacterium]|nr:hypothetical protein [Thermoanaerobacteraceae bacterium]
MKNHRSGFKTNVAQDSGGFVKKFDKSDSAKRTVTVRRATRPFGVQKPPKLPTQAREKNNGIEQRQQENMPKINNLDHKEQNLVQVKEATQPGAVSEEVFQNDKALEVSQVDVEEMKVETCESETQSEPQAGELPGTAEEPAGRKQEQADRNDVPDGLRKLSDRLRIIMENFSKTDEASLWETFLKTERELGYFDSLLPAKPQESCQQKTGSSYAKDEAYRFGIGLLILLLLLLETNFFGRLSHGE